MNPQFHQDARSAQPLPRRVAAELRIRETGSPAPPQAQIGSAAQMVPARPCPSGTVAVMLSTNSARLAARALAVLEAEHGLAHLQRFLESGLTREQVGHLRHLAVLRRPRIGWYVGPDVPETGVRAVRVGGALGCLSAAATWGIAVPESPQNAPAHVSLVPGSTRMRRATDATARARADSDPDAVWHWEHRHDAARGWRVTPLDAIVQMARCVEYRWLVAAIDSARCGSVRRPLLDCDETHRLRDLLPGHLKRAVDDSDPLAEASGETFIRLGLREAGLPVTPQVWLTELYRTDLLVGGWLPVESDGMAWHSGAEAVERDRARDAVIARLGTPPLRFTQKQAVSDTRFVVDTVAAVWRRGRPRGLADPQFPPDTPTVAVERRRGVPELRIPEGIADP